MAVVSNKEIVMEVLTGVLIRRDPTVVSRLMTTMRSTTPQFLTARRDSQRPCRAQPGLQLRAGPGCADGDIVMV
jgi:hypothetical protein